MLASPTHDPAALPPQSALAALGYVLAAAVDRETACACVAWTTGPVVLCPSGVHRMLAEAAARSPSLWRRCCRLVEDSLGPARLAFERASSDELLELAESGSEALEPRERAALIWSLLRRRDPALELALRRLDSGGARAA